MIILRAPWWEKGSSAAWAVLCPRACFRSSSGARGRTRSPRAAPGPSGARSCTAREASVPGRRAPPVPRPWPPPAAALGSCAWAAGLSLRVKPAGWQLTRDCPQARQSCLRRLTERRWGGGDKYACVCAKCQSMFLKKERIWFPGTPSSC